MTMFKFFTTTTWTWFVSPYFFLHSFKGFRFRLSAYTFCGCPCCSAYGRAYLHHLVKAQEMLGPILLTLHNLHYYQQLMAGIRGAIEGDRLDDFAEDFRRQQVLGDLPPL